ncbi:MAG TPA: helix-turn-helix transcriptional regulator [Dyella sp.]|uniref:helix-turn-helix transcriptional regulator n=1 Tax=Dyella sp. TaxID=1869338 RepID=UPI002F949FBC
MPRQAGELLRQTLDRMPGLCGCKDENSVFMYGNAAYAEAIGVDHHLDLIGRTDYDMPCETAACADLFRAQDRDVMDNARPLRILDIHPFAGGEWRAYLFSKTPLVEDNRIVGTLFQGIDITSTRFFELGSMLGHIHAGMDKSDPIGQHSFIVGHRRGAISLADREGEILFFLIRGKSCKDIASLVGLSPRTVEQHIARLRDKFVAGSRKELVDRAIQAGYLSFIPERIFKRQLSVVLG